jgi:hypothetical protein
LPPVCGLGSTVSSAHRGSALLFVSPHGICVNERSFEEAQLEQRRLLYLFRA